MNFLQSFSSDLLATIIGVILGIPVALFINRSIETRTQKTRKEKILKVLFSELRENLNTLELWERDEFSARKLPSLYVSLYTESWDAFSNGGELEWINEPILLDTLATAYNKVYSIKYLANKYFDLSVTDSPFAGSQVMEAMNSRFNEVVKTLIKTIPNTLELIQTIGKKGRMEIP